MPAVLLLAPVAGSAAGDLADALSPVGGEGATVFGPFDGAPDLGGPWSAAVELSGDDPAALAAAGGSVVTAAGDLLDPARSVAISGRRAVLFGQQGPVQIFFTLVRRRGTSSEEFERHWREVHATFVKPGGDRVAYIQLYADGLPSTRLAQALGLAGAVPDGVAMPSFPDPERLQSALTVNFDPAEAEDLGRFTEGELGRGVVLIRH